MLGKKSQLVSEVIKYGFIALISMIVLIAGYKMLNTLQERACKTEIAKFEIELRGMDKSLRFGEKELQSYLAPCRVDGIYFFDLNKNINPENFNEIPLIKDTLKNKGSNNVFLVKDGEVKRAFYAGNLEIEEPYYLCLTPLQDKISFFMESAGRSVIITPSEEQPICAP